MKAKLGPDHPHTLMSMNNLATAYQAAGKLDLALPLFEETLKLRKAKRGPDHPDTLASMNNLAAAYQDAWKLDLALPLIEETLKHHKANVVHDHPYTHANVLQEQLAEARKALPKDSPELAGLLAQIGMGLLEHKKWAEAEPLLRECLAIRVQTQPDVWSTFNTQSMLGGALLGQKKYAEA